MQLASGVPRNSAGQVSRCTYLHQDLFPKSPTFLDLGWQNSYTDRSALMLVNGFKVDINEFPGLRSGSASFLDVAQTGDRAALAL